MLCKHNMTYYYTIALITTSKDITSLSGTANSIHHARKYITFIRCHGLSDTMRKYDFGYIIIASEFCEYWTAARCDDRLVVEHI